MFTIANLYSIICATVGVLGLLFWGAIKIRQSGQNEEKLKHAEDQIQDEAKLDTRMDEAIRADTTVRTRIDHGGLRDDDGHKRRPS
jgi:hypothetical protein